MARTARAAGGKRVFFAVLLVLLFAAGNTQAAVPNVTVVDGQGEPIDDYRWLVEENLTYDIVPGTTCADVANGDVAECLSVNFHRSHMPAIAEGYSGDPLPDLDPDKRYYLSILPDSAGTDGGATIGGAPIAAGQTDVTVQLNRLPLPTAQIRVFAFHDNYPINNAPDTPEEEGLAGFQVVLTDAAGRYGVAGGQMMQDAFGNPLGTTYNADGSVQVLGDGTIETGPDGYAVIENLAPGKYGVEVVPPAGQGWIQTATIEGTKTVDAWVKADEPPFFTEFGPPGPHVFIGFVQPFDELATLPGNTRTTVSGQIRNIHTTRPPQVGFYTGPATPDCWIGLNDLSVGTGRGIYAAPCDADSHFEIANVPPGDYQLAIWDEPLDVIFASYNFTVDEAGNCNGTPGCNLLDIPVFPWFARLENYVFTDANENGQWDSGEPPIPEVPVNLRFRDGTIYETMPTDLDGTAPFDEVFPFFSWLVAEVDYTRLKATGLTAIPDAGGAIPTDPLLSFFGVLNPYDPPSHTELGPVLTEGFQAFLGQTNVLQWGKTGYAPGENGGITGMVHYATTRAENDPRLAVAEEWEPGIPRIQVALYRDDDADGHIDDLDGDGHETLADVDNYPFGWRDGGAKGDEDFDHDGDGMFDPGDALQITTTDSWDDSLPEGCRGQNMMPGLADDRCFDGLRNFNQTRPAVFDGGYAFDSYHPGGMASGSAQVDGLPTGTFIVATGEHPVYKTVKEEDRNVDFGDTYTTMAAAAAPVLTPPCVGVERTVPDYMSFQTDADGQRLPGIDPADLLAAPFAGQRRPLCDRKQVVLSDGMNAVAEFFMFTMAPKASQVVGFILDDLTNEFDPNTPNFGEKYSPPYLPISIRDWTGREISRTYSDRWGRYNAMIPSTYTADRPAPSGMAPNMLITCMNSPADDPHYNPQYSQFCYTFQYMPGTTTYLDTPVVPVSAFTGPNQAELDCSYPAGTPEVTAVSSPLVSPGDELVVTGTDFGTAGSLTIGGAALGVVSWSDNEIHATVPADAVTGQLAVTNADTGAASQIASTILVGAPEGPKPNRSANVVDVWPIDDPIATPIQDAIDEASPGDVILIHPGTYEELVVMWKPVRLQGYGADTVISAVKAPGNKLQDWRDKVQGLFNRGEVDLLPGQPIDFALPEPGTLFTEEGPGILVLAKDERPNKGGFGRDHDDLPLGWIDGVSITGADHAGAIVVNGYANDLAVSNTRLYGNHGIYGGGVRLGHPELVVETNQGLEYQDAHNDAVAIHHNWVSQNASSFGAGGGIALYTGSDDYRVVDNLVCGNFSQASGAGIGHLGLSENGLIADNIVAFNQSFNQGQTVGGGGIFVGGQAPIGAATLTRGSGSVRIRRNRIQGNHAGAGDGGGIRLESVNGEDMTHGNSNSWHAIEMVNNIIVNNVAGMAGGGVSLQDAANVTLLHNTVAHNDSTATAGAAFAPGSPNESTPQPAGIVSHAHSPALAQVAAQRHEPDFSSPNILNCIIWKNRASYFQIDTTVYPQEFDLVAADPAFWDLGVQGTGDANDQLDPRYSMLTDTTGYHASNTADAPGFVAAYPNEGPPSVNPPDGTTGVELQAVPAFDEGGNFIDVHYGPLHLMGNYHLQDGSQAIDRGANVALSTDFDGQRRPNGGGFDLGADERHAQGATSVTSALSAGSDDRATGCNSTGGGPPTAALLLLLLIPLRLACRRKTYRPNSAGSLKHRGGN